MKRWIFFISILFLMLIFIYINNKQDDSTKKIENNRIFFTYTSDSISSVKIFEDGKEYEITNKNKINLLIKAINNSRGVLLHFGSNKSFSFYGLNRISVLDADFRGNLFKVNGAVYKSKNNLDILFALAENCQK